MDDQIRSLLAQIAALEDELRNALHAREERLYYHIKGKKVEFERSIREGYLDICTDDVQKLTGHKARSVQQMIDANIEMLRGVAKGGAVRVSVAVPGKSAAGSGRLTAMNGSGRWTGKSGEDRCSGTWTAQKS